MRVTVSKSIKAACGRRWRTEVKSLIEEAMGARDAVALGSRHRRQCEHEHQSGILLPVTIILDKRGATLIAVPDVFTELDEHEIQLER